MNLRKLSLSAAALAALVPSLSFAGNEQHALKACVAALTSSLAPGAERAVKVKYSHSASSPLADYYATEYTFTLRANDAHTSARLTTVLCSASQKGEVLALRTLAAPADGTKLAAR